MTERPEGGLEIPIPQTEVTIVVPSQGREAAMVFLRECAQNLRRKAPDIAGELVAATVELRTTPGASLVALYDLTARHGEGPLWAEVGLLVGSIRRATQDGPAAVRWLLAELDLIEGTGGAG